MLTFFNPCQRSPTHGPPEREVQEGLWRRGDLGCWWAPGIVTMEKSFYLCWEILFSLICVLRPWRGLCTELLVTSHLKSESSCNIEKMLYLILFSWWFLGNCLMLIWSRVFTQPSHITQSCNFARRKKRQGFVSSKHGRINGTFLMNHKKQKIQSLLMERRSKSWEAHSTGFCVGFWSSTSIMRILPFDLEIQVACVLRMQEG